MLIKENGGKQKFGLMFPASFRSIAIYVFRRNELNYHFPPQPINRRRVGSPIMDHSSSFRVVLSSDEGSSTSTATEFNSLELDLGVVNHSIVSNRDETLEKPLSFDSFCSSFGPRSTHYRHRIHLDRRSWLEVKDPLHR